MKTGDTQPLPARGWSRERLKGYLVKRYDTRFHMSLILGSTCLVAMLSSALLLHAGVHDMRFRYPVVVTLAYLTFLCGVWVWLRMMGFARASNTSGSSLLDASDLPLPRGGGVSGGGLGRVGGIVRGGGSFDGGGASTAWAESGGRVPALAMSPMQPVAADEAVSGDGDGIAKVASGLGDLGGSDDLGAIVLLIALALAIFLASGYLVWMAPDILTEAAIGTFLAGGLARHTRGESDGGWLAGVVKKTWWPFAIVLVLALVFASYAAEHHPGAKTFREALQATIAG